MIFIIFVVSLMTSLGIQKDFYAHTQESVKHLHRRLFE